MFSLCFLCYLGTVWGDPDGAEVLANAQKEMGILNMEKPEATEDEAKAETGDAMIQVSANQAVRGMSETDQEIMASVIKELPNLQMNKEPNGERYVEAVLALPSEAPKYDYSGACPENWTYTAEGACVAEGAVAMRTPCARVQPGLPAFNRAQKESFYRVCGTPWPLFGESSEVNLGVCPFGYILMGRKRSGELVCDRLINRQEDPCPGRLVLNDLLRDNQANPACKLQFRKPAQPIESRDWGAPAPENWQSVGFGYYVGGDSYEGPCQGKYLLLGKTQAEKQKFEVDCGAPWPNRILHPCERDYTLRETSCPLGWWLDMTTGDCLNGSLEPRSCTSVNLTGMDVQERMAWSLRCKADFPCMSRTQCKKDFSGTCPVGWSLTSGTSQCVAPNTYSGPCTPRLDGFSGLTNEQKSKIAQKCLFDWPCLGEFSGNLVH